MEVSWLLKKINDISFRAHVGKWLLILNPTKSKYDIIYLYDVWNNYAHERVGLIVKENLSDIHILRIATVRDNRTEESFFILDDDEILEHIIKENI